MAYYITRHDNMAQAVATLAAVETGIDGSAAGAIQVPAGVQRIAQVLASISAGVVAVASTGGTIAIRLAGNGLRDGQQELTVGYLREDTTSTAGAHIGPPAVLDVDISVIPGNQINIQAAINGVDPGTPELDVTLVLE